jgi:glycosyltransferase involved in cell wall biosynthesis
MHVLYVHQNFPAQFGHIAAYLIEKMKWTCSFVSETTPGMVAGIQKVQYKTTGGATPANHFCARTFENTIWHCDAVYHALRARPDIKPDLIVGHSGFGSTLFLRELYPQVPIINFFEYFYRPHSAESDMDFRKDLGWKLEDSKYLRARARNAMILLDLHNCQVGYCPTHFQKSRLPAEYDPKLRVVFDGIDRRVYHGHDESLRPPVGQRGARTFAGVTVPADVKIITYCSRGFESMRGFDIFLKAAKIICDRRKDVVFLIAGTERIAYGGDEAYTGGKSFKQWVLDQDAYDLSRIKFLGQVDPFELARMLAGSDLHMYLTVPFVLSWSMVDAMSCGAVVLGSRTAPVEELIAHGQTGLLADFFDPVEFADRACEVLEDPAAFRPVGRAAEQLIAERYSLEVVMPQMVRMYEDAASTQAGLEPERAPAEPSPRMVQKRDHAPHKPKGLGAPIIGLPPPPPKPGKQGGNPFAG